MTEHYQEIVELFREWIRATEHLQGRHNQKSHGNKFGSAAAIKGNVQRLGKDKEALKRMAARVKGETLTAAEVLDRFLTLFARPYLQLGGNETVGMGWCKVTICQGEG